MRNDRAIESFLKEIEPEYATLVSKLEAGKVDNRTIFAIAVFVYAVYSCSPTTMRLHMPQLEELLGTSAELMDKHGVFDKSPVSNQLGADSLTGLLQSGKVQFKVDPKYPQAVTISGVVDLTRVFGNSAWDILINELDDSPFLTSDFPIGLEPMGQVNGKVVPLSPSLAIRIIPNIDAREPSDKFDLRFRGFRWRTQKVKRKEVAFINKTLVRCAEDLVFCSSRLDWFRGFVRRNRSSQLTTTIDKVPSPDGKGRC